MKAYLSLGSNLGDRGFYLSEARHRLEDWPGIKVLQVSSVYETKPWGKLDQPDFWNIVISLETDLEPKDLLKACQTIENSLDRKRIEHWGPRTVDIDILSYDNIKCNEAVLTLPHPHIEQREFVLAPLREIDPDYILPSGRLVQDFHAEGEVKRILAKI